MNDIGFTLKPIGSVRVDKMDFYLEIAQPYLPALKGLDGFSHLNVLWWCHLVDDEASRDEVTWVQPYSGATGTLGIFATRTPIRPNPLGLSVVRMTQLDMDRGIIHISSIDAVDGTPILDIKPYHPSSDRVREVALPAWCKDWPQWVEEVADFEWSGLPTS